MRICTLAFGLLLGLAAFATAEAREIRATSFEEGVVVPLNGMKMGLAGVSAVERNYLGFYTIGLYVPKPNPDARELAAGNAACRIALQWVAPGVSVDAAKAYWNEEFTRTLGTPQALAHLNAMITRFETAASPAQKGDVLLIDYDPESGLALTRNGQTVARYPGVEFARAVLGIWFGAHAPTDRREELLGHVDPGAAAKQP